MHRGLTYSATCQIYLVIWYFPVLLPDRDILSFAQERLIESSKIWSVKYNEVQFNLFFRGVYRLIFLIIIIYNLWLAWLDQKNEI